MRNTVLSVLAFGAMAVASAQGAFAQFVVTRTAGLGGGYCELDAAGVASVTDNPSSQTLTLGLRLTTGAYLALSIPYATQAPPSGLTLNSGPGLGISPLDPTVAHLIGQLATAKMNDFYQVYGPLTLTNIYWMKFAPTVATSYKVTTYTEACLSTRNIPSVMSGGGGSNTKGGLVQAVVFAGGYSTVVNNTLLCYGRIRLQRIDSSGPFQFDCYLLEASATITETDGTQVAASPITPSSDPNWNAETLMSAVLGAYQIRFELVPYPVIKLNDTRVVVRGNTWDTQF
jgi:hypothetical protein